MTRGHTEWYTSLTKPPSLLWSQMVISIVTCETVVRTIASEVYKFRVIDFFCMLYTILSDGQARVSRFTDNSHGILTQTEQSDCCMEWIYINIWDGFLYLYIFHLLARRHWHASCFLVKVSHIETPS